MQRKKEFIISFLYICIIIAVSGVFIKYLLSPLLPFITAFAIVYLSRSFIDNLSKGRMTKRIVYIIFTLCFVIVFSGIIYFILVMFYKELSKLLENVSIEDIERFASETVRLYNNFSGKSSSLFKDTRSLFPAIFKNMRGIFERLISGFLPSLTAFIMKFVAFFPSAVIFLSLVFISVFYFGYDYDKICAFLSLQLTGKARDALNETKDTLLSTTTELLGAYFILTFITFVQLLLGFFILKIDYAFILALLICVVDLLPILGTGTVLVPWAVVCLIIGKIPTGAGLIAIYIFILVFRQIAEPRIVGARIGMHPLLSLISIFTGLKILGFWGILIMPITVMTAVRLNEKGLIRLYKNMPVGEDEKIKRTRNKFLEFKRHDKNHLR